MHCGFASAEAKGSGSGSTTLARGKECAMIVGGGGGEENEKASASSKLYPLYHVCVFDANFSVYWAQLIKFAHKKERIRSSFERKMSVSPRADLEVINS